MGKSVTSTKDTGRLRHVRKHPAQGGGLWDRDDFLQEKVALIRGSSVLENTQARVLPVFSHTCSPSMGCSASSCFCPELGMLEGSMVQHVAFLDRVHIAQPAAFPSPCRWYLLSCSGRFQAPRIRTAPPFLRMVSNLKHHTVFFNAQMMKIKTVLKHKQAYYERTFFHVHK